VAEVAYIGQFLRSANHLILISPRRFGKSSLVAKALKETGRRYVSVNLQRVTSVPDLSASLLREFFKVHPFERSHSEKDRLVVVLDEFQEIRDIAPSLDRQLRAIMQELKHVNFVLLGSQESMMSDIFENKKSPFYHFGELMRLGKLPRDDFHRYLSDRLKPVFPDFNDALADRILDYTACHPYYSQQLAANIWQVGVLQPDTEDVFKAAIGHIVSSHALDYERLWVNFNRTNRWILRSLASGRSLQTGEYICTNTFSNVA